MLASLGEIRSIKSWSSSRNSLSLELYVRHQLTEVHTVKGVVYLPQQAHLCTPLPPFYLGYYPLCKAIDLLHQYIYTQRATTRQKDPYLDSG